MTLAVNIAQGGSNNVTFRNKLINGGMVINQRGFSGTPTNGQYTLDRYNVLMPVASKFTVAQSSTAPTGFVNSLLVTSSSAYTVGASEAFGIQQVIEGYNCADLMWGTANAKTVTLSFWVYSSLTGTFGGALQNYAADRSYPFSYTISSANTWTQASVTIAGDTTGTWTTTNSGGIALIFSMGTGATKSGTAGVWGSTYYTSVTGAVSVVGTNGATFYITGVQLEAGTTASPFEYRQYGTELALCQRYYQRLGSLSGGYVGFGSGRGAGGTSVLVYIKYANTVRATPTISQSNTAVNVPSQYAVTSLGTIYYGTDSAGLELNVTTSVASGSGAVWLGNNNSSAYVDISAEL